MFCSMCGDNHADGVTECPRTGSRIDDSGLCGKRVDRYAVERYLGGGGMGAVYRARHAFAGHPVALKTLHPRFATDADVLTRFMREARAAAAIGSPHIVKVLDSGVAENHLTFLAMELVEGEGLDVRLERERQLPLDVAVDVALQALDALGAAHRVGIVHRDLKPGNIILAPSPDGGPRPFVKICDFGISKAPTPEDAEILTRTGMLLGTPYYMAPEQFASAHAVDGRADLYALGVVLYRMLGGRLPFRAGSLEELIPKVMFESPEPLASLAPHIPPAVIHVIDTALARDPQHRWPDAASMQHALREAAALGWNAPSGSWSSSTPVISTAPPPLSGPMTTPNAPPTFQPSFTAPSAAPAFTAPSAAPAFAAPATPAPARSWRGIALAAGAISIAALGVVAGVRYFGSDADDVEDATPPAQAPAAPAMPQAPPPPPPLMYAPPAVGMPAAPVAATAPAAPSAPPGGISIDDVHAIGPLTGATREAVERAIPQMLQCRRPGQVQHVEALAIINEGGSVPIARYGNDNPGDTETANCVAHAFQASAPVPIHGNGILSWTVTLGPR